MLTDLHTYRVETEHELITYAAHPFSRDQSLKWELRYLRAYAGYDPGKAVHPGHIAVLLPGALEGEEAKKLYQIASIWFPTGTPYTTQIERIRRLVIDLQIKRTLYDSTRGELEILKEQGKLPPGFRGVTFTLEEKALLAARLNLMLEQGRLILLPDERQRRSILSVNNALKSGESDTGHGDAFWSLAMACKAAFGLGPYIKSMRLEGLYG